MNIFGEHTTTNVFASLVPIVVPWPMMALGIFTAFLQAYVFALLSAVYVGFAVAPRTLIPGWQGCASRHAAASPAGGGLVIGFADRFSPRRRVKEN